MSPINFVILILPSKELLLINYFFHNIWVKCYKTPRFLEFC